MLKLDNNLLDELGLGSLPEDQKRAMLQHIYETLELRVGTNLANQMTDQQLEEFEKFIDEGGDANQAQALQWLEANLPNYKQVVNDVFEALKAEIKQMAPQLVASAQQAATALPQQPAAPQQPDYQQSAPQPYPQQQPYQAQQYAQPAPAPQAYGQPQQTYGAPQPAYGQPPTQQSTAHPQPLQNDYHQSAQTYPSQQPPAGPSQQPPQYPPQQAA